MPSDFGSSYQMRTIFILVHREILFGRRPDLGLRVSSTARDGEAAYYENHAVSSLMPRDEHLVPVLCHYPCCHCPSETIGNKIWVEIAWMRTSTLKNACLTRSLQSSSPISLNLSDSFAKQRRDPKPYLASYLDPSLSGPVQLTSSLLVPAPSRPCLHALLLASVGGKLLMLRMLKVLAAGSLCPASCTACSKPRRTW